MRIKTLQFAERTTGWRLEETQLDAVNLLVGVSGVGKTKILDALRRVCWLACQTPGDLGEEAWAIAFEHRGEAYRWEGATTIGAFAIGLRLPPGSGPPPTLQFSHETLFKGGEELVARKGDSLLFRDQRISGLSRYESVISAFREDELIAPFFHAFNSAVGFGTIMAQAPRTFSDEVTRETKAAIEFLRTEAGLSFERYRDGLIAIKGHHVHEDPVLVGYILQTLFPIELVKIQAQFLEIFPFVRALRLSWEPHSGMHHDNRLRLEIRERSSDRWITQEAISAGMRITFAYLVALTVAPPGTVLVIDEVENGLGINCLRGLLRFLQTRPDCQIILTSHHPDVINNVPMESWKVVTRNGGKVRCTRGTDIPALRGASHHEAFLRLINLPELEEGLG